MQFQRTDGISDALYAFELALMLVRPRAPPALLGETLQVVSGRVESENNPLTPDTPRALLSKLMQPGRARPDTGVPRSYEKAPPQDPTVGLHLDPCGDPKGGEHFLMSEVPLYAPHTC